MRKISTKRDLEILIQSIIDQANAINDTETAELLENALLSGYTAPEQLGNLRQALMEIVDTTDLRLYPDGLKLLLMETAEQIDQLLRKANRPFS